MKLRSFFSNQEGAALVEFAIIAPILILLVIGLIEIGRYANFAVLVGDASRAGVQYGAQSIVYSRDDTGMQNAAVNDALTNGLQTSGITATSSHSCTCADGTASTCLSTDCASSHRIEWVTVTTTGAFTSLFNSGYLPNSFNVVQTATRRVAQ